MKTFNLSLFAYILSFLIFYFTKPSLMFDKNGNIKSFGTGKGKTIIPLWIASTVIGILTYCCTALIGDLLKPLYNKIYKNHSINRSMYKNELIPVNL